MSEGKFRNGGIFFPLNQQAFTVAGISHAEVSIYGPDSRRLTSATFDIEVPPECVCECEEGSEDYVDIMAAQIKAAIEAADRAESAAFHGPRISDDSTWEVWDPDEGQYVDTMVDASGVPGPQGAKGDTGPQGPKGADGKDGANGIDGTAGADGKDGADGITPTIGDNGNWYLGTTDTGKPSRGDTGPQGAKGAQGETGATPDIQIGTVTTLDAGENATASMTGTAAAPLLNLGIPKGEKGDKGDAASTSNFLPGAVVYGKLDETTGKILLYKDFACTEGVTYLDAMAFGDTHNALFVYGNRTYQYIGAEEDPDMPGVYGIIVTSRVEVVTNSNESKTVKVETAKLDIPGGMAGTRDYVTLTTAEIQIGGELILQ